MFYWKQDQFYNYTICPAISNADLHFKSIIKLF